MAMATGSLDTAYRNRSVITFEQPKKSRFTSAKTENQAYESCREEVQLTVMTSLRDSHDIAWRISWSPTVHTRDDLRHHRCRHLEAFKSRFQLQSARARERNLAQSRAAAPEALGARPQLAEGDYSKCRQATSKHLLQRVFSANVHCVCVRTHTCVFSPTHTCVFPARTYACCLAYTCACSRTHTHMCVSECSSGASFNTSV